MHRLKLAIMLTLLSVFAFSCAQVPENGSKMADTGPKTRLTDESLQTQIASFDQVWTTVRDRHWDPELSGVDWDQARTELRPKMLTVGSQAAARIIMNDLLGRLEQSHFAVFAGKNSQETFVEGHEPKAKKAHEIPENTATTLGGDGDPGFDVIWVNERAYVIEVRSGSPADIGGLKVGWELIKSRGIDIAKRVKNLDEHAKHPSELLINSVLAHSIGGIPGKVVPYSFRDHQGQLAELELRQLPARGESFELTQDAALKIWWSKRRLDNGVGYIAFSAFGAPDKLIAFISEAMDEFQDAPGIILDVRGNPGGIGSLASTIAGYFIDETGLDIGKMLMRSGEIAFPVFPRAQVYRGPLAMLIDGASASTAEIFAAGLKDLGRARLFGTTTAGAVLPAQIVTLPNGDGFIFASADFVSPKGKRLEGAGAEPDQTVGHSRKSLLAERDAVLDAAETWLMSDAARLDQAKRNVEQLARETKAKNEEMKKTARNLAKAKASTEGKGTSAAGLPEASVIMAGMVQASGGEVALRQVKSLRIEAEIYLGQMLGKKPLSSSIGVLKSGLGLRYHSALDLGSFGKITEGCDGEIVWESSAIMGSRIVEGGESATKIRNVNPLALVDWRRNFQSIEVAEQETIDGKNTWKLMATPNDGEIETWWVEQDTYLLLRTLSTSDSPMGRITLTTDHEDYRTEGGITIPFRVKVSGGPEVQIVEITKFEVNPVLEESLFALPPAIEKLRAKAKKGDVKKKGA